MAVLHSLRNLS